MERRNDYMTIREDVYERWFGFDETSVRIIDMPVDELYAMAKREAHLRADDDFQDKSELFGFEFMMSGRLKELYDNWDDAKCEPVEISQEDDFRMIDNGFHRIIVAHRLGLPTLKVKLRDGHFVLQKHVRVSELPKLLNMLRTLFSTDKISDIERTLADPKIDREKIKHIFIGYGGM